MAKRTIRWPFRKTPRGGLQTLDDTQRSEGLRQLIVLAHLPGESGQPFDIRDGIGAPDVTFGTGGMAQIGSLTRHSKRFFDRLEAAGRARLEPGFPSAERHEGAVKIFIEYQDLETGQRNRAEVG